MVDALYITEAPKTENVSQDLTGDASKPELRDLIQSKGSAVKSFMVSSLGEA